MTWSLTRRRRQSSGGGEQPPAGELAEALVHGPQKLDVVVIPEGLSLGETADTLAALRYANDKGYLGSLAICNVPTSSLARESDFLLLN